MRMAMSREEAKKQFITMIEEADTIAIQGHIRPDGDCVGSTLGLYQFICDKYPEKKATVFLEEFSDDFCFLAGSDSVCHEPSDKKYDLAVSLDCSDMKRHGGFACIYENALHTVNIDHHISNEGFGELSYVEPDASSTCEVLCGLLEPEEMNRETAECFYLGIVHDTGVFKFSCTQRRTMEIAGILLSKGVKSDQIIDDTFYKKTYAQNRLMAKTVLDSTLYFDGRVIFGLVTEEMYQEFHAGSRDTEGIVEQLRQTDTVDTAIFAYHMKGGYKFSLRSKSVVNVSVIAQAFGGGGHIRAAGFEYEGDYQTALDQVLAMIKEQLHV